MEKETKKENLFKKPWIQSLIAIVLIFGSLIAFLVFSAKANTVLIDNSELEAPIVNLSPAVPGILNALYVKEGARVVPGTQVALVGSQIIASVQGGLVADAPNLIGQYFSPGQAVVSIVDDADMKVAGSIEENKGLEDIKVGNRATFTVDAFPGNTYQGIVDEISPTSDDSGVVFAISDKRPTKKFNVAVRFNDSLYPELKNGMSARITVYTK